jgi:hypothetical protein
MESFCEYIIRVNHAARGSLPNHGRFDPGSRRLSTGNLTIPGDDRHEVAEPELIRGLSPSLQGRSLQAHPRSTADFEACPIR